MFQFIPCVLALSFIKERISKGGCCYTWLYLDPLSHLPLVPPSHGQDSAGLIIPQVEEDVVTKIM